MVKRLLGVASLVACFVVPMMHAEAHASGGGVPGSAVASPGVLVIVHPGVTQPSLSVAELRDLLMGNRRFWSGNVRTELYVVGTPSVERTWWVERISGMSEIQFKQYWIGQIFRGRATSAPRAVPDRRTAIALVAAVPGALALVAPGELPPSVRVVPVNGRLPADTGYPLQ
jgi:hypothetical protein